MDEPAADGARRARRRIEELDARIDRLRRGDPVTADDVAAERSHSVAAAERAEAAALGAAAASTREADLEDRVADALFDRDPERAQKHRDRAAAARRHAAEELAEAAQDHSIADRRREAP